MGFSVFDCRFSIVCYGGPPHQKETGLVLLNRESKIGNREFL